MAKSSIRLWGRRSSFHTRKVIWALNELGLSFDLIEAGFGIEPSEALRSRNPSALAPVIDDAGAVVWESNVIVRYLYGAYGPQAHAPDGGLLPRIASEQWMDWNATTLWPAVRPFYQAAVRGAQLDREALAKHQRDVSRWLDMLEAQLSANRYLAGHEFSMADIPAGLTVDRAARLQLLGERTNARRWWMELVARAAFPPE